MTSRPARLARGFAAAGMSTLVAAVSHAAGGGDFPHVALLLAGLLFSGLYCTAMAGRRAALVRVVPSVVGSQILFHLLFSMAGEPAHSAVLDPHLHHGSLPIAAWATGAGVAPDATMLLAHVVAAALTVLGLLFGERAFWGLLDSARMMFAALTRGTLPSPVWLGRSAPAAFADSSIRRVPPQLLTALSRRGPPTHR